VFTRWLKFNLVGGIGILVQLSVLALLKSGFGIHYLWATAVAVEAAILHNFVWHVRFTWVDRPSSRAVTLTRLLEFHLSNGAVSLLGNLLLMRLFVGAFHLPYLPANLAAIATLSLANFLLAEFLVFRPKP
jgi:putative flippase GtrA